MPIESSIIIATHSICSPYPPANLLQSFGVPSLGELEGVDDYGNNFSIQLCEVQIDLHSHPRCEILPPYVGNLQAYFSTGLDISIVPITSIPLSNHRDDENEFPLNPHLTALAPVPRLRHYDPDADLRSASHCTLVCQTFAVGRLQILPIS
jgi:hypothetical protein